MSPFLWMPLGGSTVPSGSIVMTVICASASLMTMPKKHNDTISRAIIIVVLIVFICVPYREMCECVFSSTLGTYCSRCGTITCICQHVK